MNSGDARMARLPLPDKHWVYAVYDGDEIVYVGLTANVAKRESVHRSTSPWCEPHHVFVVLSEHNWRDLTAELVAIREHSPKFNLVGNDGNDWRVA